MFQFARECRDREQCILVTTTTNIFCPASDQCDFQFLDDGLFPHQAKLKGITVVGSRTTHMRKKLKGVGFDQLAKIKTRFDTILIESDGAAQKPIKAPADHEPVIWPETTHVIGVIGYQSFGKPIDRFHVHRFERFASLTNGQVGDLVDAPKVFRLVDSSQGLFQKAPKTSVKIWIVNQVDDSKMRKKAKATVEYVLKHSKRPDRVVLCGKATPLEVLW